MPTLLDEIERDLQIASPHGLAYISQTDARILVAVARAAAALTDHMGMYGAPDKYRQYEATLDALAPLMVERDAGSAAGSRDV